MIRVAIVDDHPVARYGVTAIVSAEQDIEVTVAVATPEELLGLAPLVVDVVICDPYPVGHASWLDAMRGIAARAPVLVMSASREAADMLAAMHAGARGYLTKHAGDEAYVAAIRSVVGGGFYLTGPLAEALPAPSRQNLVVLPRAELSDREQETLAYIGRGFTHQQTARRMGVSKATVDTYVGRIRTKLQLGNKAELALAALRYVEPRNRLSADTAAGGREATAA